MNTLLLVVSGLHCLHTFFFDGITQIQDYCTQIYSFVHSIFYCRSLADNAEEISMGS